ncbi:hypothetical protein Tco_1203563, partial [Tanacetum coccineum]
DVNIAFVNATNHVACSLKEWDIITIYNEKHQLQHLSNACKGIAGSPTETKSTNEAIQEPFLPTQFRMISDVWEVLQSCGTKGIGKNQMVHGTDVGQTARFVSGVSTSAAASVNNVGGRVPDTGISGVWNNLVNSNLPTHADVIRYVNTVEPAFDMKNV